MINTNMIPRKTFMRVKNIKTHLQFYLFIFTTIRGISNTDFGDRWDSGQIGYIFVTKEKVQQEYGSEITEAMKELIRERLIAETELYDKYLQGECYGFRITDENGEQVDGCGGFFGDNLNNVLQEMRNNVNAEYEGVFKKMERHVSAYTAMM